MAAAPTSNEALPATTEVQPPLYASQGLACGLSPTFYPTKWEVPTHYTCNMHLMSGLFCFLSSVRGRPSTGNTHNTPHMSSNPPPKAKPWAAAV